jgi:hypothetical protein
MEMKEDLEDNIPPVHEEKQNGTENRKRKTGRKYCKNTQYCKNQDGSFVSHHK